MIESANTACEAPPESRIPPTSVVIPVRNDPIRLKKLLDSFEESDFTDCEVLVVDDGSTDNTAQVAAHYPVRVVSMEHSVGPALARNLGARETTGDVLVFLDSDVVLVDGAIRKMIRWFPDNPDVVGVSTVASEEPENSGFVQKYAAVFERFAYYNWIVTDGPPGESGAVKGWWYFSTRCGAIRKDVFNEIGGFDATFKRPSIEDAEFSYRLSAKYRTMMDPTVRLNHHWAPTLGKLLKRVFRNARMVMGLTFKRGRPPVPVVPSIEVVRRLVSAGAVALLIPVPFYPPFAILAAAAWTASCALYFPLLKTFHRAGGVRFLLGSILIHHLVSVVGLLGAASALLGGQDIPKEFSSG